MDAQATPHPPPPPPIADCSAQAIHERIGGRRAHERAVGGAAIDWAVRTCPISRAAASPLARE